MRSRQYRRYTEQGRQYGATSVTIIGQLIAQYQ